MIFLKYRILASIRNSINRPYLTILGGAKKLYLGSTSKANSNLASIVQDSNQILSDPNKYASQSMNELDPEITIRKELATLVDFSDDDDDDDDDDDGDDGDHSNDDGDHSNDDGDHSNDDDGDKGVGVEIANETMIYKEKMLLMNDDENDEDINNFDDKEAYEINHPQSSDNDDVMIFCFTIGSGVQLLLECYLNLFKSSVSNI
jgi:hypothetical protein